MKDLLDFVTEQCLSETSKNPVEILRNLMALPGIPMHGPVHHVLVGSALLTAFRNGGGKVDLPKALAEMRVRGEQVPGGACGRWGACGAAISTGTFVSIVTGATPMATDAWGLSNRMTASALEAIGRVGGPRCCKRDSYLALLQAVEFSREHLGWNWNPNRFVASIRRKIPNVSVPGVLLLRRCE